MRKQHKALAVVAVDVHALVVSPNPSVALQAPMYVVQGLCECW
jgi:hypothetical protein